MKFSPTSFQFAAIRTRHAGEPLLREAVAGESPGQVAELVVERGRLRVQADEDEAAPGVDPRRVEAVVGLVERADADMSKASSWSGGIPARA